MKTHYFIFGQNAIIAEEELTLAAHFSPESGEVGEIVTIKPTANPHLILSSYDGYAGFKEISESEYLKIRSYLTKAYPNIDDMGIFRVIEEDAAAYITEIGKLKDIVERQMFEINRLRTVIRQENPSTFYVLKIWADVDPILSRPMESKTERDDFALLTKKEDEEDSGIYWIDQVQGELKAGAYPGKFFEEDVPGKVEEEEQSFYTTEWLKDEKDRLGKRVVNIHDLNIKLDAFEKAYAMLRDHWIDCHWPDIDQALTVMYPFAKSFDEINIIMWISDVKERLNRLREADSDAYNNIVSQLSRVEEAKLTYGSKKTEAYLNELYQNEMSLDEAFEKLVYLTNKNRGKHIHEQTLRKAIQDGDVGKYIRRLDPVAYNCTRNDLGYAEEPQQAYQCGMFTGEQMKGTGQTNLLDLTDKIEDLKAVLRRMPHKYWNDPGHGWLEVRKEDLKTLGIQFAISGYSYQDGDKAYLEEDSDMTIYFQALFSAEITDHNEWDSFKNSCFVDEYRENIFIRNLNHYTP